MGKFIDIIGQKFGRLLVIKLAQRGNRNRIRWLCRCDCSKEKIVYSDHLKNGSTKSCGCLNKSNALIHGHSKNNKQSPIYASWAHMIQRCVNPNNKSYCNYGDRGITVCEEWLKFENFLIDMGKKWKPGLTIERKKNEEGYHPSNCKWATRIEQANNKRNNRLFIFNGKTQSMKQWSCDLNINEKTLWTRFHRGWSIKRLFTTPVETNRKENDG